MSCFGRLELGGSFAAFFEFEFVEFRPQDLHRDRTILDLRPLILTSYHNSGRNMRNSHRRIGHVYVLAAGTGRAVSVDPQVLVLDIDLDVLVDLGRDEHRRERRLAAAAGIERRYSHEPVHAGLGREQPVSVIALDAKRRGFDPRLASRLLVEDLDLKALSSPPSADTSAAASGRNPARPSRPHRPGSKQIALFASVSPESRLCDLGLGRSSSKPCDQRLKFFCRIGVLCGKFKQHLSIRHAGLKTLLPVQGPFDPASLSAHLLGPFLVVPKTRLRDRVSDSSSSFCFAGASKKPPELGNFFFDLFEFVFVVL